MQYSAEQVLALENLDRRIFYAILMGTLAELQETVAFRIHYYPTEDDALNSFLYVTEAFGETMLYVAVTATKCYQRLNKIDWLISRGARIYIANQKKLVDHEFNCTPLLAAAYFGKFGTLQHLIENHCQAFPINNLASRLLFATVCGTHHPIISWENVMRYLIQKFQISPWTLVTFDDDLIEPLIVKIALFDEKDKIPLKIFLGVLRGLNIPIDLQHVVEITLPQRSYHSLPILAAVLARGTASVAKYLITEQNLNMERMLQNSHTRPVDFFYERIQQFSCQDFTNDLSNLILILEFIPLLLDSPLFLKMTGNVNSTKKSLLGYLLGDIKDILFNLPNFHEIPEFSEYFDAYLNCLKETLTRVYPTIQWTYLLNENTTIKSHLRSSSKSLPAAQAELAEIINLDPSNEHAYLIGTDETDYFVTLSVLEFNFESEQVQHILLQKAQAATSNLTTVIEAGASRFTLLGKRREDGDSTNNNENPSSPNDHPGSFKNNV